jgi:type I restriction enzyme S subunit
VKCHADRANNSIPVLRIPNIASEKVDLADLKYGVLPDRETEKASLREGDILIVRTNGSAGLVGRCAVVPPLPEPHAFASYLIRLRCDREHVEPDHLQLALRHQRSTGQLFDFARTTAGQYNVSIGRLNAASFPVAPRAEQLRLVTAIDALQAKVDALKALQAHSAAELDALLPSVLDKAFKGEL